MTVSSVMHCQIEEAWDTSWASNQTTLLHWRGKACFYGGNVNYDAYVATTSVVHVCVRRISLSIYTCMPQCAGRCRSRVVRGRV